MQLIKKIEIKDEASVSPTDTPISLGENSLLTPYNNRSSSTILKDLLHDT